MTVISKSETGLIPATRITAPGKQTTITGHYFGVDLDILTRSKLYAILRNIQYGDMFNKGYSDIMYNAFPSPFRPEVILGRGLENRNAANGSAEGNLTSMSCCLPIGPTLRFLDQIPNGRQNILDSCRIWDEMCEEKFNTPLPWVGHQYWRPTGCPGDWFMAEILAQFDRPAPPLPTVWLPHPDYTQRPNIGPPTGLTWDGFNDFGYVRWLQNFLNQTSPLGCPVDGKWGPVTADRLRRFQGYFNAVGFPCPALGQPGHGMVDQRTWPTIHYIATVEGIV